MKVTREVDTVIVEMDIHVATKLRALLMKVLDETTTGRTDGLSLDDLDWSLYANGDVRKSDERYRVVCDSSGFLTLVNA